MLAQRMTASGTKCWVRPVSLLPLVPNTYLSFLPAREHWMGRRSVRSWQALPSQAHARHHRRVRSFLPRPLRPLTWSHFSIHDGSLAKAEFTTFPTFNLQIPKAVGSVPAELLDPVQAWADKDAFKLQSAKLAGMFSKAFERYSADCSPEVVAAGPQV